ncbi:MAG TPA: NUDIX domain-containing protein [Candidatus Limnocylindrales bacterium]
MEKRRRIGAYGIARDDRGRILLVRSSPRSNNPGKWVLPGGGLDHGEDPNLGVVREFREETGLDIAITGLRDVFADFVEFRWRNVILHHDRIVFDVEVTGGELVGESGGTTDLPAWVAPEEIPSLDLNPFAARVLGVPTVNPDDARRPEAADEAGETASDGRAFDERTKRVVRFGAYGVVTDSRDRVLLSLISEGYPGAGRWHLPGGGTDWGEQPGEGLLREIYEESEQRGEVTGLVKVGARHNPAAMGPEGEPLDWYTVRAVFNVYVADPTEARVTESAGSTAQARWFSRSELRQIDLSDLARGELLHNG